MATSKATQAVLNTRLECSVCHDVFQDPRNLPCGHTFCLQCLQNIVQATVTLNSNVKVTRIPCPQCRTEFSVGNQNLHNFPKNYILADLISFLPANIHCEQAVYCEIHPKKEVEFYCETCQRFACSTCTGVKCRQHNVFELPDADDKFKAELNSTLKPLQALSSNFDRTIQEIASDITRISSHHDTVQDNVDRLLSHTETKLKSLFEQLLAKLKQCKDTAKLTISELHSKHVDKLKTSLADTQKRAHTIKQHKATIEQHFTSTSTVFDRFTVVEQLKKTQSETSQAKHYQPDTSMYDVSKWQNDMTEWLHDTSDALTTATTRLPQLTLQPLVTHRISAKGRVMSALHIRNITVNEVKHGAGGVNVLSVSSGNQLLVGQPGDSQLHVYSAEGNHEASINLPNDDILRDAVWSPCGNIVYTTIKSNNVVSMSRSGNVIKRITDLFADFLSVSTDEVICLADFKNGVYQSTDDGKTWSLVIDMPAGWQCAHAIRVSTDNDKDVFWTHEVMKNDKTNRRLQVCIVDKHCSGTKVTRHNVTLPSQVTVNLQHTRLAFDGHANIFVADANNKAVYVWSVHGQYECQLLFPQHFSLQNAPKRLAVNTRNDYMYVGQFGGIIDIFKLTYKEIK